MTMSLRSDRTLLVGEMSLFVGEFIVESCSGPEVSDTLHKMVQVPCYML